MHDYAAHRCKGSNILYEVRHQTLRKVLLIKSSAIGSLFPRNQPIVTIKYINYNIVRRINCSLWIWKNLRQAATFYLI